MADILPENQRIWLTGATSGIGLSLAKRLLTAGHRVAISARQEEELNTLARDYPQALAIPLDLLDRESVKAGTARIENAFGGLDVAILNAGTCEYLDVRHFDMELVERVLSVNLFGTLYAVDAALPLLRQARASSDERTLLAVTSSASAYLPLPRAEAYGASKAALSYFMESLRLDLDQQGIDVSLIHPGFVDTPLTAQNDFSMPVRISADQAAEYIVAGLAKRRLDIHFPRRFTFLVKALGILPPALRRLVGLRVTRTDSGQDA